MRRGRRTIVVVCMLIGGLASGFITMLSEDASAYTPRGSIRILSDSDFTVANGVTSGNGTPSDPYIIEGWEIDAEGGIGIEISQTTSHFVIRECYLYHGDSRFANGIYLGNVINGRIESVDVTEMGSAILLLDSNNNTISTNHLYDNYRGVWLSRSDNNIVEYNNASSSRWGMLLSDSESNQIIGNEIFGNLYGVEISNADSLDNLVTLNNILYNGMTLDGGGLYLSGSGINTIHHNNISFNAPQAFDDTSLNDWDAGYPSGGNCWTDDGGVDGYSGPNQDQPGKDGISDDPYVIDADSEDRYPLNIPNQGCGIEWNPTILNPHDPIHIAGDSEFTPENGVIGGTGQSSDPYIIEGWNIDASTATGINISSANVCFEIRNVHIYGGGPSHFGISMSYAACGRINNVSVINNQVGVYLYRSNLVAYGSNITSNLREGILGYESSVLVENSNLTYNGGCGLFSSFTDYIGIVAGSNVTSNGGCGIAITDSDKGFIDNNNVSLNAHQGIVADIYDNDGTISGNVVFGNGGEGLLLFSGSGYLRIENNTISHNNVGMTIEGRHNHISNNLLVDNHIGVEAWWGSDNVYSSNVIVNPGVNMHFDGAPSITLSNNEMSGLGIQMEGYYLDEWNSHQIDASNTVQGKPVFYLSDAVGGTVPTGYAQVILANCTGMTVEGHDIENVYTAINLGFSTSNVIMNNNLTGNHEGIKLDGESRDNSIHSNTFDNSAYGVWIDFFSESNTIYHNNFIDSDGRDGSGLNMWDNGYPSGGNYWSVYGGVDQCSGPNQDICPDPDGIGDTPHLASGLSEDRYPLMVPYGRITFNPPFSLEAVSSGRLMGNVDIRHTRSHDEGEIYTVKWLETLRYEFSDLQDLKSRPEPSKTDEIEKLEISRTQNKFQCPNVLSAKRN